MPPAARKPPEEKAVDRAEGDLARPGALAQSGLIVEQPGDLGRGKIWVDHQTGALRNGLVETRPAPALAQLGGPAVLPDDRVMDRRPGRALPQHRRLALVGDADRGDRSVRSGRRFTAGRNDAPPDLLRVVLDPAGLRIMLGQLDLRGAPRPPRRIEEDCSGAGGALVDRQNVGGDGHHQTIPNSLAPSIQASLSPQRLLSSILRSARQARQ